MANSLTAVDPNELLKQAADSGDFSTGNLVLWLVVGAMGSAYLVYGFKQRKGIPLLAGVLLSVYPLFVSGFWLQLALGAVLIVAPFYFRDQC